MINRVPEFEVDAVNARISNDTEVRDKRDAVQQVLEAALDEGWTPPQRGKIPEPDESDVEVATRAILNYYTTWDDIIEKCVRDEVTIALQAVEATREEEGHGSTHTDH